MEIIKIIMKMRSNINFVQTDVVVQLMSWPDLQVTQVLQGHTDTALQTSLSACFEMDALDSPVMIDQIYILGIHKK
jgi:hypothetical protein